jgi:hypothetical protein
MSCFLCGCEWATGEACSWNSDWSCLVSSFFACSIVWLTDCVFCLFAFLLLSICRFLMTHSQARYIYWYSEQQRSSSHISQFICLRYVFLIWECRTENEPFATNVRPHRYQHIAVLFLQITSGCVFKLKDSKLSWGIPVVCHNEVEYGGGQNTTVYWW